MSSKTSEEPSTSTTISSSMSTSAALSQIRDTLVEVQEAIEKIEEVQGKSKSLQSLQPKPLDIEDLVALDRAHQHLLWLDVISRVLDKSKEWKKNYDLLVSCHAILVTIVSTLIETSCIHLRTYALKGLVYLRSTTLPTLETELESDLETLNYPKCVLGLEDEDLVKNQDFSNVKKFQKAYQVLDALQLPSVILKQFELKNVDPALRVLRPLKKRFKYHFLGAKKTNNPIKPEWYLQQVGCWLKQSKRFFQTIIDPVDESGSSFDRFSRGLCQQVLEKLEQDVFANLEDDVTTSHMIDEILTYSQEFYNLAVDEDVLPLVVLLDSDIFKKWLSLERKFAFAKIDDIMLDDQSWTSSDSRLDISKCTETFVTLLQSITKRFKHLNTDCQLKFVELQSELLEDMRLRFAQIVRLEQSFPLSEKYCLIMNSSQHLINVMNSWSGIPLYLQLELAKYGDDHFSGLFRDVIDGFEFFVKDLTKNLADHIFYEVKSRSKMYRDIKWFSYNREIVDPCPESLPMFQILASQVDFVDKQLMENLSRQVVTLVCDQMSAFYIHDVILINQFNPNGSLQLKLDIDKGMNAIFSHHSMDENQLETHFQLIDVITILIMKTPNAILLNESLNDAKQAANAKDILREVGVTCLDGDQVIKILNRRVDLKS